jgi:hypothetical protein
MINPVILLPGLATMLFTCFEMPHNVKKVFFKVPTWISSSTIAIIVGMVGKGVLGPLGGFATELILFPGLSLAKKHFQWKERRIEAKGKTHKVKVGKAKVGNKEIHAIEMFGKVFEIRPKQAVSA